MRTYSRPWNPLPGHTPPSKEVWIAEDYILGKMVEVAGATEEEALENFLLHKERLEENESRSSKKVER